VRGGRRGRERQATPFAPDASPFNRADQRATRSTAIAVASPPPMQGAATERFQVPCLRHMQQRHDQSRAGGADRPLSLPWSSALSRLSSNARNLASACADPLFERRGLSRFWCETGMVRSRFNHTPIRAMVSHPAYDLADARTSRSSHHRLEICSLFGLQRRRVSEPHVRTNANSKSVFS
jgi:hypothetical protein